jgi:tetratricopeptide (TPR) repeat protein
MTTCPSCSRKTEVAALAGSLCPACLWHSAMEEGEADFDGHILLEEIARGGMGVVHRALQLEPRREVALKMLLPSGNGSDEFRARLALEARALAELDHPGILPLYHLGEADGVPYFTMKLATGGSLASRLKAGPPPTPRFAAQLCRSLADATAYAHARGVLHRDIKPGNILFGDRSEVYLADFGLAKLQDSSDSLTVSARVMGTPCYMAPEVAERGAKAATTASDVYALGAVLYELLAGRPPFIVEGLGAILRKIAEDAPERPSTLNAGVPRDLELICLKCLSKEPAERYATAGMLRDDLENWLEGRPVAVRPVSASTRLTAWARRNPALASTAAALIFTALGSGAWLTLSKRALTRAQTAEQQARAAADGGVQFLLGGFADRMEHMGRLELLNDAWKYLEHSINLQRELSPIQQLNYAKLQTRWGRSLTLSGQMDEALTRLRRAVETTDALVAAGVPESIDAAADARITMAAAQEERGKFERALTNLAEAESCAAHCAFPDRWRGTAAAQRASVLHKLNRKSESTVAAQAAVASMEKFRVAANSSPLSMLHLGRAQRKLAQHLCSKGDPVAGLTQSDTALRTADILCSLQSPPEPEWLGDRAECLGMQAECLLQMAANDKENTPRFAEEALEKLRANLTTMQDLSGKDPQNGLWKMHVYNTWDGTGRALHLLGRLAEEEECFQRRRDGFAALHAQAPLVRTWRMNSQATCYYFARFHLRQNDDRPARLAKALPLLKQMIETGLPLVRQGGATDHDVRGWAGQMESAAMDLEAAGSDPAAAAALEAIIAALPDELARGPYRDEWIWKRSRIQRILAKLHQKKENTAACLEQNRAALKDRVALFRARSQVEPRELPLGTASAYVNTVQALVKHHLPAEALRMAQDCLADWKAQPATAGHPALWAPAVTAAVQAAIAAGIDDANHARSLAASAELAFFPDRTAVADEKIVKLREELRSLAAGANPLAAIPSPP